MTPAVTPLKSSLIRKTLILFLPMFVMQVLFICTIVVMVVQTRAEVTKQQEARQTLSLVFRVMRSLQNVVRVAVKREIVDPNSSLAEYDDLVIKLNQNVAKLNASLASDERYHRALDTIEENSRRIPEIYAHLHGPNSGTTDVNLQLLEAPWYRIYQASNEISEHLTEIQNDFSRVEMDAREHLQFQSSLLFNVSLVLGLIATIAVAFFVYHIFISGLVNRLTFIINDLSDMREGKPLRALPASVTLDDEIGQLALKLREMETNLRSIRTKEKTLLENSASCICSIDEDGLFVSVNPASLTLWGINHQELIGKSLTSIIDPSDAAATTEGLNKLFRDRRPVSFENKLVHQNGNIVELAWKASFAKEQHLAVCVAQDITARNQTIRAIRQSEEEVRIIVNSMPVAVVTCDETNTISSVNPATQAMLDFSPQDLLGKKLSLLLTGNNVLTAKQVEEITTAAERPIEMRVSKSDGTRLPVEFSTRRYALKDNNVLLATFKDISARFQIESVKKEFVAMISHDLRSPLTAIHGTLEFMTMDTKSANTQSDEQDMQVIQSMQNVVHGLVNVLNDFLDLEKFEAGFVALEPQEIRTSDLLETVKKVIAEKGYAGQLIFDASDEGCLDTMLFADFDRMIFALSTVLIIAILYSRTQNQLSIKAVRTDKEIEFSVDDCLLTPDVRQAFFSPYIFLSDARFQGKLSSGLSASLARAIINNHRGNLRVDQTGDSYRISITLRRPESSFKLFRAGE